MNIKPYIFLTESAKIHFLKITSNEKLISLKLKNSGCSGFSYVLETLDKKNVNVDTNNIQIHNIDGISFLLKNQDIKAFNNMVIDYKKEGINSKIVFDNPNVINACGCGESFSIKEEV